MAYHLRLFTIRVVRTLSFAALAISRFCENMQYVCGAVNESCKTYSTSAVLLLVRNVRYVCGAVARNSRNICKNKLKNIYFLR